MTGGKKKMKGKIFGICIGMLLIATALPAVGTINNEVIISPLQKNFVEWEHTYGGDEHDWLFHIQPTSHGGYIATGLTEEDNMFYAWLLKVDDDGQEEWSVVNYDINGSEISSEIVVMCVRETLDGGYIIGGWSRWYDEINEWWATVGWLWEVNETGDTIGGNIIGDPIEPYTMFPMNVLVVEDGYLCSGLYLGGSGPSQYADVGLAKIDFEWNVSWIYHYDHDGSDMEYTRTLCITEPDNEYFLAGSIDDLNLGEIVLMKVDSDGNEEWATIFNGPGWEFCEAISGGQTEDGGYITAGVTRSFGAGGTDVWIIKVDANGNEQWNKTFGGPKDEHIYGMDETVDGNYVFIIVKDAFYTGGTKEDTWILLTDSEGNCEWELIIEEDGTQWSQAIEQTDDKGFIISGRTGWKGHPSADGLILKVGPFPLLDIEIVGGLGVTTTITNNGAGDALNVPWEITITGGFLGLINKTFSGTTDIISGASETLKSGLFFGFGPIQITVTVGPKEATKEGFHLLFFTL